MNPTIAALQSLYNRIPRRHTDENVKQINDIIAEYEDILIEIESVNTFYEKQVPAFFDAVEAIKLNIKKSTDKKVSKKSKDSFFDEASGVFKDSITDLMQVYADGNRTA
jgi:hypothetical protein